MDDKRIEIKCDCNENITIDLAEEDLSWEIVEADEREMGTECLHEAFVYYDCAKCHKQLVITLHVWEYPEGFSNMDEILVDGGELIHGCDLSSFVL